MFTSLIGLGTAGFAQADEWSFSDLECRIYLDQHPGSYPAHPPGHSNEAETINEEFERTRDADRHHRKISYQALEDVKGCLRALSFSLGYDAWERNNRIEELEKRQKQIANKLDDILAILERLKNTE